MYSPVWDASKEEIDSTCPDPTCSMELEEAVLLYQVYLSAAGLAVLLHVRFTALLNVGIPE